MSLGGTGKEPAPGACPREVSPLVSPDRMTPTRREDWDLWAATHTWLPRTAVHPGNPPPRSWCGFWNSAVTALLESARGQIPTMQAATDLGDAARKVCAAVG